ncbi:hypothetical protein ANN_25813 [Periplaneta americana]|uniref:Uncharacterized protein n=1 Tax=Periplaneta americana TaxID=6978 RepID=A0ABQ8S4Z4_PERAM|nr:hypothetical protein ANN_25813 [Periplaneta americana]
MPCPSQTSGFNVPNCQTLVMPYLDYCDVLYSDLSVELSLRLQRVHNACVRFIFNSRRYDHVSEYFSYLGFVYGRDLSKTIYQVTTKNNHQQELDINISQQRRKLLKDIPPEPRRLAVASFRLNTEHDILGKHLNRLGILPPASCILCPQQEDMDRQHLAKCPALKSSKEFDRYWEARARMAIVKEDEYEEVRWDGIVSIVSWRERVFRLWWEDRQKRGFVQSAALDIKSTSVTRSRVAPSNGDMIGRDSARIKQAQYKSSQRESELTQGNEDINNIFDEVLSKTSGKNAAHIQPFNIEKLYFHNDEQEFSMLLDKMEGYSKFEFKPVKTRTVLLERRIDMKLLLPDLHVEGFYQCDRMAYGDYNTKGSGYFWLTFKNLTAEGIGILKIDKNNSITVEKMRLSYKPKTQNVEMGRACSTYGRIQKSRVLVGRPEGKRPLGRPRRRWEDNIKMDLREVGYDDRDWINLPQDRDRWRAYVRAAMNLRVP